MKKIEGLLIDWEGGNGKVKLPKEFLNESTIFRADVLKDWLQDLTVLYDKAVKELQTPKGYKK